MTGRPLAEGERRVADRLGPSPLRKALGFWSQAHGFDTRFELPWSPAVARSAKDRRIDPGALLIVMDHALGFAITTVTETITPSTTIDLRMDWFGDMTDEPATISIDILSQVGATALVRGEVRQGASGDRRAVATGRFMKATMPGGSELESGPPPEELEPRQGTDGFHAYIGVRDEGAGRIVIPASPHLAGMVRVGAFHGGVIAAMGSRAASSALGEWISSGDARQASVEIEYLRPAFVASDLLIEAKIVRAGRRSAVVEITTRQHGWTEPPQTRAVQLWVRERAQ